MGSLWKVVVFKTDGSNQSAHSYDFKEELAIEKAFQNLYPDNYADFCNTYRPTDDDDNYSYVIFRNGVPCGVMIDMHDT